MTTLYQRHVAKLRRAPAGRISYIDAGPAIDPIKLRNMLSVTANKLWGKGAAAVARDGRTIAVCRFPAPRSEPINFRGRAFV